MTDTTDIKALNWARLHEIKNTLSDFEDIYDRNEDKENFEVMRDAQVLIDELISLRGQLGTANIQLEAERQRADGYRDCIRVLADQLSVNALPKEVIEAVAALKGELANPVVLPERWKPCDCIDCAYAYDSEATKKAINEAGFTVKGDL